VHGAVGAGLGWCANTAVSAVVGLLVGAVVVVAMHLLPFRKAGGH
jgi:predicted DNA repair protein MutK